MRVLGGLQSWDHIVSTLSNKQKAWGFFFSYRGDNSWSGRDDVALPQGSDRNGKARERRERKAERVCWS